MIDPPPNLGSRSKIFSVMASGEGPWHSDGGCNFVVVPGVSGDTYLVWADDTLTIDSGSADITAGVAALGIWIVTLTDFGPVTISGASMIAHKVTLVYTNCS